VGGRSRFRAGLLSPPLRLPSSTGFAVFDFENVRYDVPTRPMKTADKNPRAMVRAFARNVASVSVASVDGRCAGQHGARSAIRRTQSTRRCESIGTMKGMSKRESACGATSDPRRPPTSVARNVRMTTIAERNEASDRRELYCSDARLRAQYGQLVPKICYRPITFFAGGHSAATNSDPSPIGCGGHFCLRADYAPTTAADTFGGRSHHLSKQLRCLPRT